jgi:hypothetical protein
MNNAPEKALWRRGEVKRFLGINDRNVTDLVEAGSLTPFYIKKGKRAFYKRVEVLKLAADGRG